MPEEAQTERPMADEHPFAGEDGEEFIAHGHRGEYVTLNWKDEHGRFVEVGMDFRPSALAAELLRVVAERDEARARELERVYGLAMRMADDPHGFFAIPLDKSRAEYCSMALREFLRRLEEPEEKEVGSGR